MSEDLTKMSIQEFWAPSMWDQNSPNTDKKEHIQYKNVLKMLCNDCHLLFEELISAATKMTWSFHIPKLSAMKNILKEVLTRG